MFAGCQGDHLRDDQAAVPAGGPGGLDGSLNLSGNAGRFHLSLFIWFITILLWSTEIVLSIMVSTCPTHTQQCWHATSASSGQERTAGMAHAW